MPDFPHTPAAFEGLTASLWRERELLDHLLFGLTSQRVLLEAGTTRWLATSSAQVADVVDALREHEVDRSMITEGLADELGLAASASLDLLASEAPEPYCSILGELGSALRELTVEVAEALRCNDRLLLALVGPESSARPFGAEL